MTQLNINIRSASLEDVKLLREFEQGVITAERPFAANLKAGEIFYYDLEALIASNDSNLLIAEMDGLPVACGYATIRNSKPHITPDLYSYIGFIYVVPEQRGKKLAGHILQALVAWSKSRDVHAFELEVFTENESAIRAYEKFGFKANLTQMWMSE
ncbi:MAG: GNAT family N-acetyltransferase [Pseudomonadota bacterium]